MKCHGVREHSSHVKVIVPERGILLWEELDATKLCGVLLGCDGEGFRGLQGHSRWLYLRTLTPVCTGVSSTVPVFPFSDGLYCLGLNCGRQEHGQQCCPCPHWSVANCSRVAEVEEPGSVTATVQWQSIVGRQDS